MVKCILSVTCHISCPFMAKPYPCIFISLMSWFIPKFFFYLLYIIVNSFSIIV